VPPDVTLSIGRYRIIRFIPGLNSVQGHALPPPAPTCAACGRV